jgi:hypothetical protein
MFFINVKYWYRLFACELDPCTASLYGFLSSQLYEEFSLYILRKGNAGADRMAV